MTDDFIAVESMSMTLIITPYTKIYLFALIFNLTTGLLLWRKRRIASGRWMLLAVAAVEVWVVFTLLSNCTIELWGKILWSKLEYLGANTTAPLFFIFAYEYTQQRFLPPRQLALFFVAPLIGILFVFTNDWHYLFWTGFTPLTEMGNNSYIFHHGPAYWFSLTYNYFCGAGVMFFFIRNSLNKAPPYGAQMITLLVSSLLPFAAGLLYSLSWNPFPGLDFLPIAFSLAGLGIVFSITRWRMFDLAPLARDLLVERMNTGMLVIDQENRIVDINQSARTLLKAYSPAIGDPLSGPEALTKLLTLRQENQTEIHLEGSPAYDLEVLTSLLNDRRGNTIGQMVTIRDITARKKAEATLRSLGEQNAVNTERQRMARELHDVVTQNLYSMQLFARSGVDYSRLSDWNQAQACLEEIQRLSLQTLKDMRLLLFQLKPAQTNHIDLVEALKNRLETVERRAQIATLFEVEQPIYLTGEMQATLYSFALEVLNNSLKHARASSVSVKIRQQPPDLRLEITDDGQGFDKQSINEQHGYGFTTMRERAELLHGKLDIQSSPGKGTIVSLTFPPPILEDN